MKVEQAANPVAGKATPWFHALTMSRATLVITGTDTAVGKTVVASLLASHLRRSGLAVAALKPFCSGGRDDAVALREAAGGLLGLEETNPWHFPAALAPLLAARQAGRSVRLPEVLAWARRIRRGFDLTLIEGAGGLLSPLGEGFDARHLIIALRALPIVVSPNRLGAVNQVRLVLAALPAAAAASAQLVLVNPPRVDRAGRGNPALLAEYVGHDRVHVLPWLSNESARRRAQGVLQALCRAAGLLPMPKE